MAWQRIPPSKPEILIGSAAVVLKTSCVLYVTSGWHGLCHEDDGMHISHVGVAHVRLSNAARLVRGA